MERSVSEPYSPYDYVQQKAPHPAFDVWDALSDEERAAVLSFQDLGTLQDSWDVKAPDERHINCSIVNSYLRFPVFREGLSAGDVKRCESLISLLDSAVSKSVLPKDLNVIRGLYDSRWTESFSVGDTYVEQAYGSYSLSVDAAVRYARVNTEGKMVFFARSLKEGERGLYMGRKEEEILVERGCVYRIEEIAEVEAGVLSPEFEGIVYMLVKI